METKERLWKFFDDNEYKTYQDYLDKKPEKIFTYYGNHLEKDTKNLLDYEYSTITSTKDAYPLVMNALFFIIVPKNRYTLRIFEVSYPSDKLYPCKFHSILTENRYDCENYEELNSKMEQEINDHRLIQKITTLLYQFYDREEVEKIMSNE